MCFFQSKVIAMFSRQSDFLQQENSKLRSNIILKCRGCLKEESDMNSVFIKNEENTNLATMIEESIGYVISEEEQFSDYLCKKCTKIIVDFIGFRQKFKEATEYFKSLRITHGQNNKDFNIVRANNEHKDCLTISERKDDQKDQILPANSDLDVNECEVENLENCDNFRDVLDKNQKHSCQNDSKTENLKCKFCNASFKTKLQVRRHERTMHSRNFKKRLKKTQVSPKSSVKTSLKKSNAPVGTTAISLEKISNGLSCKQLCKICKNYFPEDEFTMHFESHKTHVCNTCGHRFIRRTDLHDHLEIHLDVCKYICQHCGKAFKARTVLNKHKRIHTNPREEICDVCGQRFNTRDTLKTHYKLKHIKSKDFQCNLCGLAFTLKSTLEKHIERHNPNRQRIYSCNLCNVSYINKYNLSRHHVIKHTAFENRPTCEFCGKGYIKKVDLDKHLKKHHAQNVNSEKMGI